MTSLLCIKRVGVLPSHAKPPRNAGKGNRLKKKEIGIGLVVGGGEEGEAELSR